MGYRVKAKKSGGGCCDCAVQQNGCSCEAGGNCTLQCEAQEGSAGLCGYAEFTTPSSPPKKYKTKTLAGSFTFHTYAGGGCTGAESGIAQCSWSGACSFDPATCVEGSGGSQTCFDGTTTGTGAVCGIDFPTFSGETGLTPFVTPTSRGFNTNLTCQSPNGRYDAAAFSESLSNEDTEDAAEGRAVAAVGSFSAVSCGTPAVRGSRAAGEFTFTYRRVRVRAHLFDLVVGLNYSVQIDFYRRTEGSMGPYTLFSSAYFSASPGPGDVPVGETAAVMDTSWQDVPGEAGYETIAQGCTTAVIS